MSKKCINPECEFFDKPVFDDSDERCSWCNSELVNATDNSVAPTASPQPAALPRTATTSGVATASGMGTHVQSDTRYNSDDIQFGGSQFNAQSVDNRTQNSSVTNVTHIGTEDGEQLIKCPVTFRRFKKKDAYCCPICNKDVSPEGFNKELGMCGNCAKKKQEEEKATLRLRRSRCARTRNSGCSRRHCGAGIRKPLSAHTLRKRKYFQPPCLPRVRQSQ